MLRDINKINMYKILFVFYLTTLLTSCAADQCYREPLIIKSDKIHLILSIRFDFNRDIFKLRSKDSFDFLIYRSFDESFYLKDTTKGITIYGDSSHYDSYGNHFRPNPYLRYNSVYAMYLKGKEIKALLKPDLVRVLKYYKMEEVINPRDSTITSKILSLQELGMSTIEKGKHIVYQEIKYNKDGFIEVDILFKYNDKWIEPKFIECLFAKNVIHGSN